MFKLTVSLRMLTMVLRGISSVFAPVLGFAGVSGGVKLGAVEARDDKAGNMSRTCGST
jgi:hypothetical protein